MNNQETIDRVRAIFKQAESLYANRLHSSDAGDIVIAEDVWDLAVDLDRLLSDLKKDKK